MDAIITYVNSSDSNWLRSFSKATGITTPSRVRFRSWGTLKYLLRGIDTYMPFVQNVILVVSGKSQIPAWLNETTVRVVCHEEFIPKKFLPTFNSCTIESFFWNIPDLSDKVIYFNDDMFPTAPMLEEDFFTDNTPHIKFNTLKISPTTNMYRQQCRSGLDMVTTALNLPSWESGQIIRPYHITTAFTKEGLDAISSLCQENIMQRTSALRQNYNVNQYIYAYWHYFTGNYIPDTVHYKYFEIHEKSINEIMDTIMEDEYSMVCINDSDKIKDFNRLRYQLNSCFDRKFPSKCKYEL